MVYKSVCPLGALHKGARRGCCNPGSGVTDDWESPLKCWELIWSPAKAVLSTVPRECVYTHTPRDPGLDFVIWEEGTGKQGLLLRQEFGSRVWVQPGLYIMGFRSAWAIWDNSVQAVPD